MISCLITSWPVTCVEGWTLWFLKTPLWTWSPKLAILLLWLWSGDASACLQLLVQTLQQWSDNDGGQPPSAVAPRIAAGIHHPVEPLVASSAHFSAACRYHHEDPSFPTLTLTFPMSLPRQMALQNLPFPRRARTTQISYIPLDHFKLDSAGHFGAQLDPLLQEEFILPLLRSILWSHSTTVLTWMHLETCRYKIFVAYRITEILDFSIPEDWKHVPSSLNLWERDLVGPVLGYWTVFSQPTCWPVS